jgi:hypothetical protein
VTESAPVDPGVGEVVFEEIPTDDVVFEEIPTGPAPVDDVTDPAPVDPGVGEVVFEEIPTDDVVFEEIPTVTESAPVDPGVGEVVFEEIPTDDVVFEEIPTADVPAESFDVAPLPGGNGGTATYQISNGDREFEVVGGLKNNGDRGVAPFGSLQVTDDTAAIRLDSNGNLTVATPITDVLGEGDKLTPKVTAGPNGSSVGAEYQNGLFTVGVKTNGSETTGTVNFDTGKPAPRDPSQFTPSADIDQATQEFIENRDNPAPEASDESVPGYSLDGSLPPSEPATDEVELDLTPAEQQEFDEALLDASAGDFELDPVSETASQAPSGEEAVSLEQPTEFAALSADGDEASSLTAALDATEDGSATPADVGEAALLDSAFTPNGAPAGGGEAPFLTATLGSTADGSGTPTDVGEAALLDSGLTPGDAPAADEEILLASNTPDGVVSDTPDAGLIAKLPKPEKNCAGDSGSYGQFLGASVMTYSPCQVDTVVGIEERNQKIGGVVCIGAGVVVGVGTKNGNAGGATTAACGGVVGSAAFETDNLKRIGGNCKAQDQYTRVSTAPFQRRQVYCVDDPTPPQTPFGGR